MINFSKQILEWIWNQNNKIRITITCVLFTVVYAGGMFLYQGYQNITQAYTEYRIRENIKQFDIDKAILIKKNNETIKKYQKDILDMEACNKKQKMGENIPATCDIPKSIMNQANASENIFSGVLADVEHKFLKPSELFYTTAVKDGCHVSQGEEDHFEKKNGGMLATDVACRFGQDKAQRAVVYVPDYAGESKTYTIINVGHDKLLGDYIELVTDNNKKWIIAHIETKRKVGDVVQTGEVLGQQNLSGATTGYHTHIELWKLVDEQWINVSYSTRSKALSNKRAGLLDDTVKIGMPIYSTQYNLGDVNQNDDAPNIGASGKDLRHVDNPIALTVDIRKLYNLKFGDKIQLNGPCPGTYSVEDEMNIRFRTSCIQKEGGCIKMDIAIKQGEQKNCSGLYTITK